jgi:glycosyltransferase involved in cell wall biosynthesis
MDQDPDLLISVAICTYDRYPLLEQAIASCLNQAFPVEAYEIIVVDNSPDVARSARMGGRYEGTSRVRYLVEERPGLSNARNVAVAAARAPVIAFLDDDAIASQQWLSEIAAAFRLSEGGGMVGIVGGRIDPIWTAERPAWLHDRLLGSLSVVDWGGVASRVAEPEEWFAGANIAFDAKALAMAGGFRTNLGRIGNGGALLSNEETELSKRIEDLGFLRVYAPLAKVDHLVPEERLTQAYFRRRAAWQAASDLVMQERTEWGGARAWEAVTHFIASLPSRDRTTRGLFVELEDPERVQAQMDAIYSFTLLALTGFEDVTA